MYFDGKLWSTTSRFPYMFIFDKLIAYFHVNLFGDTCDQGCLLMVVCCFNFWAWVSHGVQLEWHLNQSQAVSVLFLFAWPTATAPVHLPRGFRLKHLLLISYEPSLMGGITQLLLGWSHRNPKFVAQGQIGGMQLVIHEGASTDAPGPKNFFSAWHWSKTQMEHDITSMALKNISQYDDVLSLAIYIYIHILYIYTYIYILLYIYPKYVT